MHFKLTEHTLDMLKERNILEEWVWQALKNPEQEEKGIDNNIHYFKAVKECGGHVLHVVVNPHVSPKKVVTVFFDRRARRQK